MNYKINWLFIVINSIIVVTFSVKAEVINYMVIQSQAQPLQIEEYNQNHRGIVSDIVYQIFNHSDYRLNTVTLPFKQLISDLESSRYQNWITVGSPNWEGIQAKNLSKTAILSVKHHLIINKNDSFNYKSISDLDNKVIILLTGFDYPVLEEYIKEKRIKEIRAKNFSAAFKLLKRLGNRACFIEMDLRIKYNQKLLKIRNSQFTYQSFSSVIPDYNVHLAFDSNMDTKVSSFINEKLKSMHQTSALSEIISKYR